MVETRKQTKRGGRPALGLYRGPIGLFTQQIKQLDELAAKSRVPRSALVREAVGEFLAKRNSSSDEAAK